MSLWLPSDIALFLCLSVKVFELALLPLVSTCYLLLPDYSFPPDVPKLHVSVTNSTTVSEAENVQHDCGLVYLFIVITEIFALVYHINCYYSLC